MGDQKMLFGDYDFGFGIVCQRNKNGKSPDEAGGGKKFEGEQKK